MCIEKTTLGNRVPCERVAPARCGTPGPMQSGTAARSTPPVAVNGVGVHLNGTTGAWRSIPPASSHERDVSAHARRLFAIGRLDVRRLARTTAGTSA